MQLPQDIIKAIAIKAKQEYDLSYPFVQRKRQFFRENYKYMMNQGNENKIYERLMFRMVDMMCALSHKFKPSVTFTGRSEEDAEYIKYLELVKEFDYEEMGMETKKYRMQRYKFVFGVGIEVRDTFNKFSSTPQYKVINPMSWIPDVGYDINTGFRYHGFELETTLEELEYAQDFFNLDKMKDLKTLQNERGAEQQLNHLALTSERKLNDNASQLPEGVFAVYQHFTTYKGNKYEIRLANDKELPVFARRIKPVLEEEKNDQSTVSFGVNVRHYRPLPGDPYGVSFAFDLLLDKQKQLQVFNNLNLIKAKETALGAKYLFDPEIVTAENVDVLKKAYEQPVYIPVPGLGKTVSPNAVYEIPKAQLNPAAFQFATTLEQIAMQDTSMDERTMGMSPGGNITKAENERVQQNANIRLLLGANFDVTAEKEFYKNLRYREYVENKKFVKNKFVELTNGVQVLPIFLNAKDFITKSDPRMKAVSTLDAKEKKDAQRLSFMAVFNTLYQGATSEFGKNKLMKKMAELHDVDKDTIDSVFGKSSAQMQAMEDLNLINKGIVPKIGSIDEDHDTFIDIYNSSPNTETKLKAIFTRELAKIAKGEQQQQQQEQMVSQGIENQALAQASNKNIGQVTSLAQV